MTSATGRPFCERTGQPSKQSDILSHCNDRRRKEIPHHHGAADATSTDSRAAGTHSESVGRIKLVGLDEVRSALGDRWPAVAQRAMATAESVIKRHCGPHDSFSRADDTSFLMCFGTLSEEEASFRAAMIGREIRNRLIGQGEDPDNAYVRSVAAVVRFPDQRESNASFQATLLNGLDKQLERLEQQARQTLTDALGQRRVRPGAGLRARSVAGRCAASPHPRKSPTSGRERIGDLAKEGIPGLRSGWIADRTRCAARGFRPGAG